MNERGKIRGARGRMKMVDGIKEVYLEVAR